MMRYTVALVVAPFLRTALRTRPFKEIYVLEQVQQKAPRIMGAESHLWTI